MAAVTVRDATEDDFAALTKLDLSYTVGDRYLELERLGSKPELTYTMRWRDGTPQEQVYATLTVDGLQGVLHKNTDAFFVAEVDGALAGYLMIVVPRWTDAAEITDLAVHRTARRAGAGRALVDAAAAWARDRGLRALWVEPRGNFAGAIAFYVERGFRISGFNDRMYSNADDIEGQQTLYMYLELG